MNNYDLVVVCVIYDKELDESSTIEALRRVDVGAMRLKLIVWNNGPFSIKYDKEIAGDLERRFFSVSLVNSPVNRSLSRIYNEVFDDFAGRAQAFCLLDDDTILPEHYFFKYESLRIISSGAVYFPAVFGGGRLVSPAARDGSRLDSFNPGVWPVWNFRAIASGMVIPASTAKTVRFDERFDFYGADTDFVLELGRHGWNAVFMDVSLSHSISTDVGPSIEFSDFKYRSLLQSFKLVGVKHGMRLNSLKKILRLGLRQGVASRRFAPIICAAGYALDLLRSR